MSGISGLQMDASGSGKFHQGAKSKNLAGQSGIGVLAVGFSLIRALKQHALLVFSVNNMFERAVTSPYYVQVWYVKGFQSALIS